MNPKYLLFVCFLLIISTACAPAAPTTAETQSTGAAEEAEEGEHSDEEGEHSDEEGEHSDEEDHHEDGEHSDEEDEHGHEDGEGERRELGAHEHGAAELMIAWSGSDLAIDLETPSYNVLGFEYEPSSDEEKALMAESVAMLESGELLQINPDAGCAVLSVNVQTAFGADGHDEEGHDEEGHDEDKEGHDEEGHDEEHDDHSTETHSEIDVSYNLECEQPENITALDASQLFAQFPNFEDIQVQWISDTEQSAADLTPDNAVLELK